MTRFARAKGSKASNEKAPEDGTPWEVMKEQLLQAKKESEDAKKRQEAEKQRIENYENFLKEQKVQKRKATWCDFPEVETENQKNKQIGEQPAKKKNKKNKQKLEIKSTETFSNESNAIIKIGNSDFSPSKKKKNKHKMGNTFIESDFEKPDGPGNIEIGDPDPSLTKKRKKRNRDKVEVPIPVEHRTENSSQDTSNQSPKKKKKSKNKKLNSEVGDIQIDVSFISNTNTSEVNTKDENNVIKKKKKTKKDKNKSVGTDSSSVHNNAITETIDENKNKAETNKINKIKALKKKKNKKLLDSKPVRRKEINDRSFQLIISGKEVELVKVDGFPIMKKDAERLAELKDSMIKKGIPKSEVHRTMKLERRRAEKALARLKRDVCYNCRKGGHNLSDCPELKSKIPGVDAAEGVCFKCGSTEHRQIECKVQRDKEFRFATCFICKEPGHIARQCPDNPKGLYPNGGSCKLCGDVTHLRKDCPTANYKKEETSVKLHTLDSGENVEDIGQQMKTKGEEMSKKPKKIKF